MCNITTKISDRKQVTGYKIACKLRGRYYSPATGVRYDQNAPVPKLPRRGSKDYYRARRIAIFADAIFLPDSGIFKETMAKYNLTAVFVSEKIARQMRVVWLVEGITTGYSRIEIVILKMILSSNLYNGLYVGDAIYLGSHINNFVEM